MLVFNGVAVIVFLCLSAFIVQVVTGRGLDLFAVFFWRFVDAGFFRRQQQIICA